MLGVHTHGPHMDTNPNQTSIEAGTDAETYRSPSLKLLEPFPLLAATFSFNPHEWSYQLPIVDKSWDNVPFDQGNWTGVVTVSEMIEKLRYI